MASSACKNIQLVIAEEFPGITVKLVRARLGRDVGNRAGAARVLRRKVICLDGEFLHEIRGWLCVRSTAQSLVGHSVKKEAVEVGAIAVDVSLDASSCGFHVDLRRVHGARN